MAVGASVAGTSVFAGSAAASRASVAKAKKGVKKRCPQEKSAKKKRAGKKQACKGRRSRDIGKLGKKSRGIGGRTSLPTTPALPGPGLQQNPPGAAAPEPAPVPEVAPAPEVAAAPESAPVPSLVVGDEGPAYVSPAGVAAITGGTCATVYEAQQGDGAQLCAEGSWPEPGGEWRPWVSMKPGDSLRLTFSAPVSEVSYALTTDYPTGLHTPSGRAVSNVDIIPPTSATSTASPEVWTLSLPNPLSGLATGGPAFAVVARDASGYHDYSFTIEPPTCVQEGVVCPTHP